MSSKSLFVFISLFILGQFSWAQNQPEDFPSKSFEKGFFLNNDYTDLSYKGMSVLGGLSLANIGVSTFQLISTDQQEEFHLTNIGWNVINLGIAGLGIMSAKKKAGEFNSFADVESNMIKTRNFIFINAGIDALYIGSGFLVRSRRKEAGNAIIYNGVLLLLFDTVFGSILTRKIKKLTATDLTFHLQPNRLGLSVKF